MAKFMWNREPVVCVDGLRKTNFVVLSEELAAEYIEPLPHIAISITSPKPTQYYLDKHGFKGEESLVLPHNPQRLGALFLRFDDYSKPTLDNMIIRDELGEITKVNRLFRPEDAEAILKFVEFYINDVQTVVVNCQAGISRSAGVAAALARIYYNGQDAVFFKRFHPNNLVYKILTEAYFGSPYENS